MAEFTDIMEQARRMCEAYRDCSRCALYRIRTGGGCAFDCLHGGVSFDEVEYKIRAWAKEHPEPVYPSWVDGWRQLFPKAIATICPLMCATGSAIEEYRRKCAGRSCDECKGTQMNAEVAEKLGIKPIGGE